MFKVALVNIPERVISGGRKYYLPFSLLYLAAYLDENGVGVDIIDIKPEKSYYEAIKNRLLEYCPPSLKKNNKTGGLYEIVFNRILEEAGRLKPNLIGISCMTSEYSSVMNIASALKDKLGLPIVVGGIHPSLYPEQFIYDKSPVDFVVIGEGEDTMLELARCMESDGGNYESIDGLAYLKDGRCHRTEIRALKEDFLISPVKMYNKLDMDFYTRVHAYTTRYVRISGTQVLTSRGCPYRCTFCSTSLVWKMNKGYKPIRYRPIKSVVEEIKFLRDNYFIDSFYIMDDTFCIDKKRVEEFCSELKNSRIGLVWGGNARSNFIDEPLLKKMKNSGLVQLDVGVESGSERMLKEIEKGIKVEDTMRLFSLAHKNKIRIFANLMCNLPGETLEDLQETIDLIRNTRPSAAGMGIAVPLPKTELFNKYLASKLRDDKEMLELLGKDENYYMITDERFRLCKYHLDFLELTNRIFFKYFLFSELQFGAWYWRTLLRSKRKGEYFFSILYSVMNVLEKIIRALIYNVKKALTRKKSDKNGDIRLLKI